MLTLGMLLLLLLRIVFEGGGLSMFTLGMLLLLLRIIFEGGRIVNAYHGHDVVAVENRL
jgi:hypothetical protein